MTLRVGRWWSLYIRAGSRDKLFEMQEDVGASGFRIIDGAVAWMASAISTDGVV